MLFNFTDNYKFTTRIALDEKNLEIVEQAKLLGVIITDDLKWGKNTEYLVKKAYMRLELLRKVSEFSSSIDDKREIYILYIRSILEQSSVVWHSSLTNDDADDLERVQKAAIRLILGDKYENYENGLIKANLESLKDRRKALCKNFALKCVKSDNLRVKNMFPIKEINHSMKFRNIEKYEVDFANTGRLKDSAIPYMQRMLNCETMINEKQQIKRKIMSEDEYPERRKRRKPG